MNYVGLDIGTTGCKATVIDENGKDVSYAYSEYSLIMPKPGYMELNAQVVWHSVKKVLSDVSRIIKDIKAIAIASFGESFVALDKKDRVIGNSILFSDIRGAEETKDILNKIDDIELFSISGMPINSMYTLNKLLWVKKNDLGSYMQIDKIMLFGDFIYYMLSGERVIDYSLASRTLLYDYVKKDWSTKLLNMFDIDKNKLSKPKPTGSVIGKVSSMIADELGLNKDILIITGGHDQICAALGAGVLRSGQCVDGIGTAECLTTMIEHYRNQEYMRENNYCIEPYAVDARFVTLAFNNTAASLLKWYRNVMEYERQMIAKSKKQDIFKLIESDCPKSISNIFVLPHFAGSGTPYMDERSRGAILGLSLNSTRGEIYKACLESLSLEMKINIDLFSKMGTKVKEILCVGGASRSELLLQIKADILGVPIKKMAIAESGTMGLAMLCAKACGDYDSFEEASSKMIRISKVFYPDMEKNKTYDEKYHVYKNIFKNIKNIGIGQ